MKKIFSLYSNLSISVKAAIWFVLCNCIQKSVHIITTPIYTRLLSQTQYGQYSVFLSWIELIAILTTLDIFYSGYNIGMSKFKNDRDNYTSSMLGLCFTLTSIWFIIIIFFSSFFSRLLSISEFNLILLFMYMYLFPVYQFWSAKMKFEYEYKSLFLITFLMAILSICLGTFFAVIFEQKDTAVLVAKILAEGIISFPLIISILKKSLKVFDLFYWKYALKFNIPLIPHYVSTMILNHSDRIMILKLCNSSQAAIYSVAYSVAMLVTIIQNALTSAVIPWLYNSLSKCNYNEISKKLYFIFIVEAILNLFVIAMAPELILLVSTGDYFSAIWIIPPVAFGIFITGIYGMIVNIELYFEYTKIAALSSLASAGVNIILNYIFITRFGFLAAGYTTFVSYFLLFIIHYFGLLWICKREKLKVKYFIDIKKVILLIISFAALACLFMLTFSNLIIRLIFVFIFLFLFYKFKNFILSLFINLKK